jgi:excisionase family DNA binding protein
MSPHPAAHPYVEQRLLTRHEVGAILAVNLRHVDRLLATNELPVVRIGKSVRVRPADLDEFIANHTAAWRREGVNVSDDADAA